MSGAEQGDHRTAFAINDGVGLGGQPAMGPADGVIVRFVPPVRRYFLILGLPLCDQQRSPASSQQWRRADAPRRRQPIPAAGSAVNR